MGLDCNSKMPKCNTNYWLALFSFWGILYDLCFLVTLRIRLELLFFSSFQAHGISCEHNKLLHNIISSFWNLDPFLLHLSWCWSTVAIQVRMHGSTVSDVLLHSVQITEAFLNGHSNPMVRIIGCKTGPVLEHLGALEPQENPLRYSPLTSFCWSTTYYIPPGCLTFLLASLLYIKNHPVSSSVTSFFLAHGTLKTKAFITPWLSTKKFPECI